MSTTPPPPPPPDDPYPPISNGDLPPDPYGNDDGLDAGRPNVAASPGRVFLVLGLVGFVLIFLLYMIFFSGDDGDDLPPPKPREVSSAVLEPPPLPVERPAPPIMTPPPVPQPTKVQIIRPQDDSAAKAQQQARLRSSMLVANSGGGLGGMLGSSEPPADPTSDTNSQFEAKVVRANTKAARVAATHIGNLHRTIAQGRLIQATMESSINTDLPGPVRAIVSRDTYAEAGTVALIPKGSRLIGQYNTDLLGGQSRVYLVWTRVIRPDGVDVMINSPLVDRIGQAGIGGQVDTKFQQVFSRAILASVVTIGVALGSDAVTGGGDTSTTSSTFGTTQSGEGATTATVNALNRLGSTTDQFLRKFIDLGPTILVDQGTPVNVFVNRDLVFPAEFSGTRVIE